MDKQFDPMTTIVSDIECNGFLYQLNTMHCGVNINPFTLKEVRYGPDPNGVYVDSIRDSSCVIGHNFRGFDLPALRKLFGFNYEGFCFDTLVLSRLLDPERNAHSLEYWGNYLRFHKDSFGKTCDWAVFSDEMMEYCSQDVRVNAVLFLIFIDRLNWCGWFGVTSKECKALATSIKRGDLEISYG